METVTLNPDSLKDSPRVGGSGWYEGGRDVYLYNYNGKPAVVKEGCYYDNGTEVEIWERVKDTPCASMFAEIYASTDDHECIVMERASQVLAKAHFFNPERDSFSDPQMALRFADFCQDVRRQCGRFQLVARDLHAGNIGLRDDGSFMVIDYGNFDVYPLGEED